MNLLGWYSTAQSAPPAITAVPAQGHDSAGGTVSVSAANGVLANVTDINSSGRLSVSSVNGSSADVGVAVAGDFGALTLNADGSYTYVNSNPGAVTSAHSVAEDTFNFTIGDGQGDTASSSLTVLITSANAAAYRLQDYPIAADRNTERDGHVRGPAHCSDHHGSCGLVADAAVLVGANLIARSWRQQERLDAARIELIKADKSRLLAEAELNRQRDITEQSVRFNAAVENMSQGLCMFDSEDRLVVCNRLYAQMYMLPAGIASIRNATPSDHRLLRANWNFPGRLVATWPTNDCFRHQHYRNRHRSGEAPQSIGSSAGV